MVLSKQTLSLTGSLTHYENASNTMPIVVNSISQSQLRPSVSERSKRFFLDDNIEITSEGTYYCNSLHIYDSHFIPNVTASLDSIILRVGRSDNLEVNLGEPDAYVTQKYIFDQYGNCTQEHCFKALRPLKIQYIGMMQSAKLNKGLYDSIYVNMPITKPISDGSKTWNLNNLEDYSEPPLINLLLNSDYWEKPGMPPYRMTQYIGSSKGNLDVMYYQQYSLTTGSTDPQVRKENVVNAWRISMLGGKSYPYVADHGVGIITEEAEFKAKLSTGYKKPGLHSKNATNVFFYEEEGGVIVNIDYHKVALNDTIYLPEEFDGLKISVLDCHDSLSVISPTVDSQKIIITSKDDIGYATILCEKNIPENIVIRYIENFVELSWDSVPDATSYKVYAASDPYGSFLDISEDGTFDGTSWSTSVLDSKRFYYVVAVKE